MAENRRNNPNANRRPVPQGRGQAGSANRRPVQGQGNNPARPQGKPNGRPVGKPGSKPNSKPQQMRKRKLQSKPVNNPQPSMPAPSPEELAKKQEAEIERINKQIQEAEQKKYERDIPKESRKEKKQKVKKEKKVKEKKKSLDSHVKADRNAVINGVFGAIAASAAILVLSFVVIHLINYVAEKPQFAFIADGAIEHTIGAKALIVRDEKPVQSGATGELITSVTEGSRVATAQSLAMIVPEDKKSTVADLHNVQSQISDVQQEIVKTGSVDEADKVYKDYNSKIEPIIDSIRKDSNGGELHSLSTYSSSISVLLDEREAALSDINFNDERISILRNDEKMYQNALQRSSSIVKAPSPGIASFRLDGQEGELTFDSIMSTDKLTVRKMINSAVGAMTANYNVKPEQNILRIVQNEKQLLAVYLNKEDAAVTDFAVGTKHDINVSAEGIVIQSAEVVRCEADDNGMLIIFSTTKHVEDLLDLRSVDIEIVITRSGGMRVSMTSLVNTDLLEADKGGFSVYFPEDSGVIPESFTPEAIFNINLIPNPTAAADGSLTQPDTITIAGCQVLHSEKLENGGVIVGFSTANEYAKIITVNNKYPDGYQAVFIDTTTGLGTNVTKIVTSNYRGIASIYVNNQGFVAEHRVLISDYDREFAIIMPIADAKIPDHDTVIILNPSSCKPNDKVV